MISDYCIVKIYHMDTNKFTKDMLMNFDTRVVDNFSCISMYVAQRLFLASRASQILPNQIGITLATDTGPYQSVKKVQSKIIEKGFVGINPSEFPNIMLSSCLCRISTYLNICGPSIAFYLTGPLSEAIKYAKIQIKMKRCLANIILHTNEDRKCFGIFLEKRANAIGRGMPFRFELK